MNDLEQAREERRLRDEAMTQTPPQLSQPWHPAVKRIEPTPEDGVRVWLEDESDRR